MPHRPVVLAILDGFGVAPDREGNAITQANTPNFDRFLRDYPAMTVFASGNEVGLSFGEMGNSEVGHLNIGAGRVYYQTLPRINKAIQDGSFFEMPALEQLAQHVKTNKSTLHLMGLVSPGNVHASQEHLYAILQFCKEQKVKDVYIHAFLDGRDTSYKSAKDFIAQLMDEMKRVGIGKIATLSGRYYAMDRDNRWERIESAFRAMVDGVSETYADNPLEAIEASYAKEVYDEEFIPTVIGQEGKPTATISAGDGVLFFNFRPDRARQLTRALVLPAFSKFERKDLSNLNVVTMTEYEKETPVTVVFPPMVVHNCLAEVISKAGLRQFHVAETEKYAHITFFLNGTVEDPFPLEDRKIIPSPQVSSYDQAPEMSAKEVAAATIEAVDSEEYDAIFLNFANADMVGHTGDYEATKKGIEAIDRALGQIADHILLKDGILMITADHGNAEEMINSATQDRDKEHSTNPVPLYVIGNQFLGQAGPAGDPPEGDLSLMPPVGILADIAPTMLALLGVDVPPEMTGRPLI
jgi:2,3-bisphosphoglycerate-independent phosphoglycerate mutase